MPKVSVIMPVYNAEKYLKEAIDSILSQTFADFEFIILDDSSSDSSPEIVRSYQDERIRFYINEQNMGVAKTLNKGLDLATGEYIARMDSDDISLPERFEKQVAYLDKNPKVGVLGCGTEEFGEGLQSKFSRPTSSSAGYKVDLLFNTCVAHPAAMIRKSALGENRYEEKYNGVEDHVLWWRIAEKHDIYSLYEVLFRYRRHKSQVTQVQVLTKEFCEKTRNFIAERISVLDKTHTEKELNLFYKYSIGERGKYSEAEIDELIAFFKKLLRNNRKIKYFKQKYLRKNFGWVVATVIARSIEKKENILGFYKKARKAGVLGKIQFLKLYYHYVKG